MRLRSDFRFVLSVKKAVDFWSYSLMTFRVYFDLGGVVDLFAAKVEAAKKRIKVNEDKSHLDAAYFT